MVKSWIAAAIVGLYSLSRVYALDNGLVLTPPMGWNTWSEFQSYITEAIFRETADSMVSRGFLAAGYNYMNMDALGRYNNKKALGEWLRAKGFKFGAYGNDVNWDRTETQWVAEWVNLGADYVKYDAYLTPLSDPTFQKMKDALAVASRPMVFSANSAGGNYASMVNVVNVMRTGPDIYIPWEDPRNVWTTMIKAVNLNNAQAALAKPGYWNDPDFVMVGHTDGWEAQVPALTYDEQKTHFGLWCIMAAPLLIGTDIRKMKQEHVDILLNREVIAIDQDSLGYQGRRIKTYADQTEVWAKYLKNGDRAVLVVNFSSSFRTVTLRWQEIGMAGQVQVRDIWEHTDLGPKADSLVVENIPAHGCSFYRMSGQMVDIAPMQEYDFRIAPSGRPRTALTVTTHADGPNSAVRVFDMRGRFTSDEVVSAHGGRRTRIVPLIRIGDLSR